MTRVKIIIRGLKLFKDITIETNDSVNKTDVVDSRQAAMELDRIRCLMDKHRLVEKNKITE